MDYYKLFEFSSCSNIVLHTVYLLLNINKEILLETKFEENLQKVIQFNSKLN